MEPPQGAFQRAVLVAVPVALVVLIVVTPGLIGRERPATSIPFLLVQIFGEGENETENETALLYVQGALAVTRYAYMAINVTGEGPYAGSNWSAEDRHVPSLSLKVPVDAARNVNVTTVAVEQAGTYRLNLTLQFLADVDGTVLRVAMDDGTTIRDVRRSFTASMRRDPVVP